MAILEKEVWITLGNKNINHYEMLGYDIPRYIDKKGRLAIKKGTKICVKVEHLTIGSNVRLTKVCDEVGCGKQIYNQTYASIVTTRKESDGKDRCQKCGQLFGADNKRKNIPYEKSLEYWAIKNSKDYLLKEFSVNNLSHLNMIFKSSNDVYKWICPNNHEYLASPNSRTSTLIENNCPYCSGHKILVGFNDLFTTHKYLANMLVNKKIGYEVSSGSRRREIFKCSECGFEKSAFIYNVVNYGFVCPRCSDGIPYPEKFLNCLLSQLQLEFEVQKTFVWSKNINNQNSKENKKYDFYIPSLNIIIETHGGQHYSGKFESMGGNTLAEEKLNDALKKELALNNGISKYIVIDCRRSLFELVRKNILESELSYIFDLSNIDWLKCHQYGCNSLVKIVCQMWESGIKNMKEIGRNLKISEATVRVYLKQGAKLSWCDYDPKNNITKKIIQLSIDGDFIKEWNSMTDAAKYLNAKVSNISCACRGYSKTAEGFKWIYKDEYYK